MEKQKLISEIEEAIKENSDVDQILLWMILKCHLWRYMHL